MAGLESTGFVTKTVEEILADIEAEQLANIDPTLDLSAESVLGNLNAIVSTKLRELWELGGIVYDARRPGAASYASLDALCAFTGTTRRAASRGLVTLQVRLTAGTTLTAGAVAHVAGQPSNRWQTTENVTNSSGVTAWVDVAAEAESTGRAVANADTITVIATPVTGWVAVNNGEDAAEGSDIETDAELRLRREVELSRPGTATVPAITADLADVEVADVGVVQSVFVEENASAFYDEMHRPPHSIEAIVQFTPGLAGDDLTAARQALAEQLWASKPGGIDTFGTQSGTVTDTNGQTHTLYWTEPEDLDVYVSLVLDTDPATYAGDDAVTDAILEFGEALKLGQDVIRAKLLCAIIDVEGVNDVTYIAIGTAAESVRQSNLSVAPRQLAAFDSGRVVYG